MFCLNCVVLPAPGELLRNLSLTVFALNSEASENGPPFCLQPSLENPYRLATWLDVLQFSADAFAWAWRQLRIIRSDVLISCAACQGGQVTFYLARDLEERTRTLVTTSASALERSFRLIGLRITADTIKDLEEELQKDNRRTSEWLHSQVEAIERLATKELEGRVFLYVPDEDAKFFPTKTKPFAFGEDVADKFPSSTFDANSAAIRLATSQSTAAAFHLMRVLEIGLRVLADRFNVPSDRQNWQNIIEGIEKAVRDIPKDSKRPADSKEQQEFFLRRQCNSFSSKMVAELCGHALDKCTEEEARLILNSVCTFMQKLAMQLHE
jgi:pimeloyl-ACP methyl ester carboxylesterase